MDYLQQYIDLRRSESNLELFAIALALSHIRALIQHGGSDRRRPDDDSALLPHHLEAFLTCAVENPWKDKRVVQEWRRMQPMLPQVKGAWERGQSLFQEDLDRAKSDQEYLEYFSMIDFDFDCYAYASASRLYPDNSALRDWAINGYMLAMAATFPNR